MNNDQPGSPTKILVPIDFSSRSKKALSYAAMLADAFGSSLIVMTNLNVPERSVLEEFAKGEGITVEEAGRVQLEGIAGELAPGIDTSVRVTSADYPADGILQVAEVEGVDMIVIASHGRAGMTRWLLGSVAEKIARGAAAPVVVVPAREAD